MEVKFIGTASGIATHDRNNCCVLLKGAKGGVLLDCGESSSATLARAGVDFDGISSLFISHMHADHFGGLLQLVQHLQLTGRKLPFNIHMPEEGVLPVETILTAAYLFPAELPFKLELLPLQSEETIKKPEFSATAFANRHLEWHSDLARKSGLTGNPGQSFSFRIEMDGQSVVYSGDIKDSSELGLPIGRHADLLISELAHVRSEELFPFLRGKSIGRTIITHIHPARNEETDLIRKECPDDMKGRFDIAYDNMEVSL
jgi:ribonuclease BN (tRNA processing enzyme)